MLEDIRRSYESTADVNLNFDWRHADRNALFNSYCVAEEANDRKQMYGLFSALLIHYWNAIGNYYRKSKQVATIQDCYEWLVEALMYCVAVKAWKDPKSGLLNDPNGPDKCMNVDIKYARLSHYQKSNTDKRRINATLYSIDSIYAELGDGGLPVFQDYKMIEDAESSVPKLIIEYFKKQEYFMSFMIYRIITEDVFDRTCENGKFYSKFNKKKLAHLMKGFDNSFIVEFASTYHFSIDEVKHAVECCLKMSVYKIYSRIERNLKQLLHSKYLKVDD